VSSPDRLHILGIVLLVIRLRILKHLVYTALFQRFLSSCQHGPDYGAANKHA